MILRSSHSGPEDPKLNEPFERALRRLFESLHVHPVQIQWLALGLIPLGLILKADVEKLKGPFSNSIIDPFVRK